MGQTCRLVLRAPEGRAEQYLCWVGCLDELLALEFRQSSKLKYPCPYPRLHSGGAGFEKAIIYSGAKGLTRQICRLLDLVRYRLRHLANKPHSFVTKKTSITPQITHTQTLWTMPRAGPCRFRSCHPRRPRQKTIEKPSCRRVQVPPRKQGLAYRRPEVMQGSVPHCGM